MGLEKELLSFQTLKSEQDFPEDLAQMIRLLLQSKTIEEAILTAQAPNPRASGGLAQGGFSYTDLYKSLQWLRDHRILRNKSVHRFIDNSQSEYVWPRSLLKLPLLEFVVWQNSKTKKTNSIGFTPWVLLFPLFLIFVGIIWSIFKSLIPLSSAATSTAPLYSFVLIIFTVSFLRTAQAIAVSITHELLGLSQSLKWVVTPLSMNLEVSDRSHPKIQILLARVQIMIAALSPLIFWLMAARTSDATPTLFFATCIWLLSEFSPLTQSELTLGLKDLFSVTPTNHLGLFQTLHKTLVVLWISAVGTFLVFALQGQIFSRLNAFLGSTSEAIPSFFFLIFLAYFIFAILDEILQGAGLTDESATTKLRRIFRTEAPPERISKFSALTKNLDSFSALPIIQFFPAEAQAHFQSTSQLLKIKSGSRVCQQGDTSRDLFILLDGSLKIFRRVAGNGKDYLARIAPISVFGEMSFFMGVPRTASVIAEEDSVLLKIPHSTKLPDLDTQRMLPIRNTIWALQAMSQNQALSQLPSETLSLLLKHATYQTFDAGRTIAIQGDLADSAFIIVEGEVLVSQNGTPIRTVRKGDLIGEIALFLPTSIRTATLQAATSVLALKIHRDHFSDLLRNDLGLALRVEKLMLSRLEADRSRSRS